ncbi:hypothetical protein GCM10010967_58890 [Dyadobacter beijingensis]|uniref:Uncharacterized protein n=1 Tax=Dyadobacter beijingensis TaxID=365489 RepID=A0ABQ2IJZ5_9BACT|nr:hypothetical protein GCM10010967_58890 [Dyadobacter beijingensis]
MNAVLIMANSPQLEKTLVSIPSKSALKIGPRGLMQLAIEKLDETTLAEARQIVEKDISNK